MAVALKTASTWSLKNGQNQCETDREQNTSKELRVPRNLLPFFKIQILSMYNYKPLPRSADISPPPEKDIKTAL